jgi:hypothetical protein
VLAASIITAITTRRNNPEDNHLHSRRRENLKSHFGYIVLEGWKT